MTCEKISQTQLKNPYTHPIKPFSRSLIFILSLIAISGCSDKKQNTQGYIEGNYTYITPQVGGKLSKLAITRGENIKKGQLLFKLNPAPENDEQQTALANVYQARAKLDDSLKGAREPKIKALLAKKRAARANVVYARKQLRRYKRLARTGYISRQNLDQAKQSYRSARANFNEARQNIITSKLSARVDQILAAKAALDAAQSKLKQATWYLNQKTSYAPFSGIVYNTYYRTQETVAAGQPVLSLLSPQKLRVIFYVSAKQRAALHINQPIQVHANDIKKTYTAFINYMSPQAAYTPPLIFSNQNTHNLVFQIKAKLNTNTFVYWPGQPVIISWSNRNSTKQKIKAGA